MTTSVIGLSIDCADPVSLAGFWSPIQNIEKPTARWTTFADPEGNEFDLIAGRTRLRRQYGLYNVTGSPGRVTSWLRSRKPSRRHASGC
jgi:hypothetical protein